MKRDAAGILEAACEKLSAGLLNDAAEILRRELPFIPAERISRRRVRTLDNDRLPASTADPNMVLAVRKYTPKESILLFLHDGFLDEYTGERLICPAALRAISILLPAEFPYHNNSKFSECHAAYWDLCATVDHVIPITLRGADLRSNWVTTSMTNNLVKRDLTLERLNWTRRPRPTEPATWDGLTLWFVKIARTRPDLFSSLYFKSWYRAATAALEIRPVNEPIAL